MDGGKIRQRNRFSEESSFYEVGWDMEDDQRALFKGILKNKLSNGSDFFNITLPINEGLQLVKARFIGGSYNEQYHGVLNWRISATLECFEVPTWSEEVVDGIILIGSLDNFETISQNYYDLYNITIPLTLPK